jgi:SAM-dependent methyltransferase
LNARFWDSIAGSFEESIFDVLASDQNQVLRTAIARYADGVDVAADFGCGVGRMLPLLAPRCPTVYAVDFAPRLLQMARRRCEAFANLKFVQADLYRTSGPVRGVQLAVAVNALISPDPVNRLKMLRSIRRCLRKGAHLLIVVPSLESELLANARLIEWNQAAGLRGRRRFEECLRTDQRAARNLLEGIIDLEGLLTKHYLREELVGWLTANGVRQISVDKVEYAWNTYFKRPPRWMSHPLPWDWLFVGRV